MDADLIATLTARDPRLPAVPSALSCRTDPPDITARARSRFVATYSNVAFGWDIASAFALAKKPFPIHVVGRDYWLWKAFLFNVDSVKYLDVNVLDAWGLASLPEARNLKTKVCSLLLSGCGRPAELHRKAVADTTNIPLKTIEAFDLLFYNILDRHKEYAYISEQVYPHTRMVEMAEDYMKHADIADIVKRAGYNNRDLEMASFLAGIGDASYMAKLSARSDREQELTRHLMGNALLLVSSGALNQRSVGLSRAQSLMVAQRQSGQTAEVPVIADAGAFMSSSLTAALATQDEQRLAMALEDAGG